MSKPTALILNDTSNAYHWGCFGTSTEIRCSLEELGYHVSLFGVADISALKSPPRTDQHMQDSGFQRIFLADNPHLTTAIEAADVVVVNGEGTLHGLSQAAMNLLYVSNLAKRAFQKRVHLINTSVYPCDWKPLDRTVGDFYQALLAPLDRIVVREPISLKIAEELGLQAELGFDCLPRYLHRERVTPLNQDDGPVILGGGLGLNLDFFVTVLKEAQSPGHNQPFVYVTGAQDHVAQDDKPVLAALTASGLVFEHRVVPSFREWADLIRRASCLISGRFHHTIAATFLGTPSLTFRAGTPKIDGLNQALGLPAPIDCFSDDAREDSLERLATLREQGRPQLEDQRRAELLNRAGQNFVDL